MKVMVATSDGGHWVQMRRILPAFAGFELVYVGTEPGPTPISGRCATTRSATSRGRTRTRCRGLVWQLARAIRRERPDAVVTTGAAPGLIALALGKAPRRQPDGLDRLDRQHRADVHVGADGAARGRRLAGAMGAPRPAGGAALLGGGAVIFVTIGSMFPFDRLIRAMDAWAEANPCGRCWRRSATAASSPRTCPGCASSTGPSMSATVARAELIVAHAGMGTVITGGGVRQAGGAAAAAGAARRAQQRPSGRHGGLARAPAPASRWRTTRRRCRPASRRRCSARRCGGGRRIGASAPAEFLARIRAFVRGPEGARGSGQSFLGKIRRRFPTL